MKCHILFSEKNKKNISKCRLLKILPRVLSVKVHSDFLKNCVPFNPFMSSGLFLLPLFFEPVYFQ